MLILQLLPHNSGGSTLGSDSHEEIVNSYFLHYNVKRPLKMKINKMETRGYILMNNDNSFPSIPSSWP